MTTEGLRIQWMPIDEIPPHPDNPKDHDLPLLKDSIRRFGFVEPIVLDEAQGVNSAGHGRVEALREMFAEDAKAVPANIKTKGKKWLAPVLRGVSFNSDAELKAFLVASNRIGEVGGWDDRKLNAILTELRGMDTGMVAGLGFSSKEMDALIRKLDDTRQRGKTPDEKLEGFENAEIKQIVLFFGASEYDAVLDRLRAVMEREKVESHTEAFLKLLDNYEQAGS